MITRRGFIAGTVAIAACNKTAPSKDAPKEGQLPTISAATSRLEMPMRTLGKTDEKVSRIGIGGAHLGKTDEAEAIRIVRSAIDRGVNFMDNSWDYNGGKSEERMGKALRDGYRQKAFLMTKIDGRTKESATAQLHQSLERLQTDVIDLVQIHEVIRDSDPAACFAPGGCIEALVEARASRQAALHRLHGSQGIPRIHLAMLKAADDHHFEFDTLLMPLNVMDAHFRSFEQRVLPVALEKRMGILSMKPIGSGDILESKTVSAVECLEYALHLPTSVVITGCDSMGVLDQAIHTVLHFQPLTKEQVADLLGRTRDAAMTGRYERFKTSDHYDSTAHHPEWLG